MKMIKLLTCVSIAFLFTCEAMAGSFTDSRDGKSYKTVKIGQQTWMAENLNYSMEDSYCYDNEGANCRQYGRLYTWKSAMKACPSGWHLPSGAEFETLLAIVGTDPKELRTRSWKISYQECVKFACSYGSFGETIRDCKGSKQCNCGQGNSICMEYENRSAGGDDSYGWSALPAGHYFSHEGKFSQLGSNAYFWSSTEESSDVACSLDVNDVLAFFHKYNVSKADGSSVRCLQDSN